MATRLLPAASRALQRAHASAAGRALHIECGGAPLLWPPALPYAMRARMALLAAGVEFDAFDIVLRDKPQALREISPKATVPVLLLPTARVC